MKFFHLSDLHIGKQLFQYSLYKEQEQLLKEIVEEAKKRKPDAIVIAGDVYDKSVPSAEAVQIFDAFLTDLSDIKPTIPVFIIAGNHDSAKRLDYASAILEREQIYIVGTPPADENEFIKKYDLLDEYGTVRFYLLPFTKPGHVRNIFKDVEGYEDAVVRLIQRENIDPAVRNVLVTHQFYINGTNNPERSESEMITVGTIDSVDVKAVEVFDYAAMGHIHRMQHVREERFAYSGTIFPYSVSESTHEKGFFEVELGPKGTLPQVTKLLLNGIRTVVKIIGTMEDMAGFSKEHSDDYVSIVLTDEKIPYDAKDVLESYFSNILEIRFDNKDTRELMMEFDESVEDTDPLDIFKGFFYEMYQRELNEKEHAALVDAINTAIEFEE